MANGDSKFLHDAMWEHLKSRIADLQRQDENIRVELSVLRELDKSFEKVAGFAQNVIEMAKRETNDQPLSKDDINNKSQREILRFIAERNHGWLVVQPAIKLMVAAGILSDESGSAQVYTVLKQNDDEFMQVSPGIYRLKVPIQEDVLQSQRVKPRAIKGRRDYQKSGLADKVDVLLQEHPDWKSKQLLQELQRQNWDFGNKTPIFSVVMAYANIMKRRRRQGFKQAPLLPHT